MSTIECISEKCQMDVLIYFCGISTDLVVVDLNPDRATSLLKKSPRFRDVKLRHIHSLRHSSLRLYSFFSSFLVTVNMQSLNLL